MMPGSGSRVERRKGVPGVGTGRAAMMPGSGSRVELQSGLAATKVSQLPQ